MVERHEEMPVNGKQRETNKRDDLKINKTLFKLKDFPVFIYFTVGEKHNWMEPLWNVEQASGCQNILSLTGKRN